MSFFLLLLFLNLFLLILIRHNKSDCTNERVEREFTGTCRICEQPGHRGKDCPSAPPKVCKRCLKEGHVSADCDGTYKALWSDEVKVLNPEQAWTELGKADQGGDLDDFKIVGTHAYVLNGLG